MSRILKSVLDRLGPAKFGECLVATELAKLGWNCSIGPLVYAKNSHEARCFSDQVDIMAYHSAIRRGWQVEVKTINKDFSSPEDFPSGWPLVCSESIFQRKWGARDDLPRYVAFFLVSSTTANIVVIPGGTWVQRDFRWYDHTRGEPYQVVRTKKEYLRGIQAWSEEVTRGR